MMFIKKMIQIKNVSLSEDVVCNLVLVAKAKIFKINLKKMNLYYILF